MVLGVFCSVVLFYDRVWRRQGGGYGEEHGLLNRPWEDVDRRAWVDPLREVLLEATDDGPSRVAEVLSPISALATVARWRFAQGEGPLEALGLTDLPEEHSDSAASRRLRNATADFLTDLDGLVQLARGAEGSGGGSDAGGATWAMRIATWIGTRAFALMGACALLVVMTSAHEFGGGKGWGPAAAFASSGVACVAVWVYAARWAPGSWLGGGLAMLCVGASPKFIAFAGATTAPALAVQLSLFFLLIVVNRLGASCRDPVIAVESWARHRRLVSLGGIVVILAVVTVLWPVWGSRAGVAVIAIVLAVDAFTLGFRSPFSRAVCAWVLWWDYMKTTALVVVSCVMLGPLALLGLVRLPRVIRRLAWTLRFVSRWRRRHIRIAEQMAAPE